MNTHTFCPRLLKTKDHSSTMPITITILTTRIFNEGYGCLITYNQKKKTRDYPLFFRRYQRRYGLDRDEQPTTTRLMTEMVGGGEGYYTSRRRHLAVDERHTWLLQGRRCWPLQGGKGRQRRSYTRKGVSRF